MNNRNPDTIYQTQEKPMKKKFFGTVPCNEVGANDENGNPEKRFKVGWNPVNSRNGHRKTK